MTAFLSTTDVAIREASKRGTLRVESQTGRFGAYWSISDEHGLIEVAMTAEEANSRVEGVNR